MSDNLIVHIRHSDRETVLLECPLVKHLVPLSLPVIESDSDMFNVNSESVDVLANLMTSLNISLS